PSWTKRGQTCFFFVFVSFGKTLRIILIKPLIVYIPNSCVCDSLALVHFLLGLFYSAARNNRRFVVCLRKTFCKNFCLIYFFKCLWESCFCLNMISDPPNSYFKTSVLLLTV